MPASSSEGRRAAQASASPMDNDQAERDANLKKVQARDLVEFGMIPVSIFITNFKLSINDISWTAPYDTRFICIFFFIIFRNLSADSLFLCRSIHWMLIC